MRHDIADEIHHLPQIRYVPGMDKSGHTGLACDTTQSTRSLHLVLVGAGTTHPDANLPSEAIPCNVLGTTHLQLTYQPWIL